MITFAYPSICFMLETERILIKFRFTLLTMDMQQSKMPLTIDKCGLRNNVFHFKLVG